jgi:hypothetical protein
MFRVAMCWVVGGDRTEDTMSQAGTGECACVRECVCVYLAPFLLWNPSMMLACERHAELMIAASAVRFLPSA